MAAAAAAAALTGSRGVTSVRATKGLFFIFTLLCLGCLANSLTEKEDLDKLTQDLQNLKRDIEIMKAHHMLDSEFAPKLVDDGARLIEPLSALLRKTMPKFTPLLELMEDFKPFIESSKTYVNKEMEKEAAKIDKYEEKFKILERKLKNLQEMYDEL